jgi:Zn-dependent peptidase ImmA (M78 family)
MACRLLRCGHASQQQSTCQNGWRAHEFHHLLLGSGGCPPRRLRCERVDRKKGAEVFAAEFIYEEAEFAEDLDNLGLTVRQPSDVVDFKRSCKAKVSYRFICKRLKRIGRINPGQFDGTQFQKLEYKIYGVPFYRRRR